MVDFAAIVTDITTAITPAIVAAVGLGVSIYAVRLGWRFVKSLGK
jgi:hypothetical protein